MKLFALLSIFGCLLFINVNAQSIDVALFKKTTTLLGFQTTIIQQNDITKSKVPEKKVTNKTLLKDFYGVVDGTVGENITVKEVRSIGYWELSETVIGNYFAIVITDNKTKTKTFYTLRTIDATTGKIIESFYPFATLAPPTGLPKNAIKTVTASLVTPGNITLNQYYTLPTKKRHVEKTKFYKISNSGAFTEN